MLLPVLFEVVFDLGGGLHDDLEVLSCHENLYSLHTPSLQYFIIKIQCSSRFHFRCHSWCCEISRQKYKSKENALKFIPKSKKIGMVLTQPSSKLELSLYLNCKTTYIFVGIRGWFAFGFKITSSSHILVLIYFRARILRKVLRGRGQR